MSDAFALHKLRVVDTHTGGEPTRVLFATPCDNPDVAWPDDARSKVARTKVARSDAVRTDVDAVGLRNWLRDQADFIRTHLTAEPRGSAHAVGAVVMPLTPDSNDPDGIDARVVFFNNRGYLAMCGHGLIGVIEAMRHAGRLSAGVYRLDTPAGRVTAELLADGRVRFDNVPAFVHRSGVTVDVELDGKSTLMTGDIAWGGNWFFMVKYARITDHRADRLTGVCVALRDALNQASITGPAGEPIDHIELGMDHPTEPNAGINFVLCPGDQYDRSPCGTGTSAAVACLASEGRLRPGEVWTQYSITGSRFDATYRTCDRGIVPTITGRAFVCGETTLHFDPADDWTPVTEPNDDRRR